jgi:hypothetical protein
MKQTMYFNAGGGDDESVGGELGNVLVFAETLSKMFCQAEPLEDGVVRVVLPDLGSAALVKSKWEGMSDDEELPDNLQIDYLPSNLAAQAWEGGSLLPQKFVELMDAELLIILAPKPEDAPGILKLLEGIQEVGRDIPVILVNAQLGRDEGMAGMAGPGLIMKKARKLLRQATHTFHLAQYVPESEDPNMAAGVVARVWPRPFSTWEDYPDDPESNDGYFLMDLDYGKAPDPEVVFSLLETSRDERATAMQKLKTGAKPRVGTGR